MKVLLIGDLIIDVSWLNTESAIASQDAMKAQREPAKLGFARSHGSVVQAGGVYNVARQLRLLGAEIVTVAPNFLHSEPHEGVAVKNRYYAWEGQFSKLLFRIDHEKSPEELRRYWRGERDGSPAGRQFVGAAAHVNDFDAVIISDYNKGFITKDLLVRLAQYLRAHPMPVFLETKSIVPEILEMELALATVVSANDEEIGRILPHQAGDPLIDRDMEGRAYSLNAAILRDPLPWDLFIKCGAGGALYREAATGWIGWSPAKRRDQWQQRVRNTCGAGDAAIAALVFYWIGLKQPLPVALDSTMERCRMFCALDLSDWADIDRALHEYDSKSDADRNDPWIGDPRRHFVDRQPPWGSDAGSDKILNGYDESCAWLIETCDSIAESTFTIVSGVFDQFHAGHAHFFDHLSGKILVLLNDDESAKSLKGDGVQPLQERAAVLVSRGYMVQSFSEEDPWEGLLGESDAKATMQQRTVRRMIRDGTIVLAIGPDQSSAPALSGLPLSAPMETRIPGVGSRTFRVRFAT